MPQLDPSTFASQIFWLIICFLSLYAVMSWLIVPSILKTLDKRQDLINVHLEKAKELKTKAEKSLLEYEKAIEKANASAMKKQDKTLSELNETIDKKQKELEKALQEKIKKAEKDFAKNKDTAIKEASMIAEKLSKDILSKLDI